MDAYEIAFKQAVVDLVRASKDLCDAMGAVERCVAQPDVLRVAVHLALGRRYDVLTALRRLESLPDPGTSAPSEP